MVVDITQAKKDVVVIAGTCAGKSLPYQSIPIITGGIVLVVSPTIALMEDQVGCLLVPVSHVSFAKSVAKRDYLLGLNITAVALTAATIESDPQYGNAWIEATTQWFLRRPRFYLGYKATSGCKL